MKKITLLSIFAAMTLVSVQGFPAKFYKWTDEDGNTYYSDKVPEDQNDAEEVRVSNSRPSSKGASKAATPSYNGGSAGDEESSEEESTDEENNQAQLKKYCDDVKSNIKTLQIGGKIQSKDADGNTKYLDEEQQKAKLKQYQLEESTRCGGV